MSRAALPPPRQGGVSLMVAGLVPALVQGGRVGPILRRVGEKNGLLAGVFAPSIGAWSFAACISPESRLPLPGIAFFEAAILSVAALACAVRAIRTGAPIEPARV